MSFVLRGEEVDWKPHQTFKGLEIKSFLTKKDHKADITIAYAHVSKGTIVSEHIHAEQDDNIYILSGRAKMWVDGIGEFELKKGSFIRVLKGTKHKVYDVTEDVLALDIFAPAI